LRSSRRSTLYVAIDLFFSLFSLKKRFWNNVSAFVVHGMQRSSHVC
jgi:hypothetical protein